MSELVACSACGAVFTRENVPTRQCPVCDHDGVEHSGGGLPTKHRWWEKV